MRISDWSSDVCSSDRQESLLLRKREMLSRSTRLSVRRSPLVGFLDHVAGDDVALDLIGAFDDLEHLGVSEVAVDRILVRDAGSAEELDGVGRDLRSEEHTSEIQSLMRISYAVF